MLRVAVDMDGVCVDWEHGYCRHLEINPADHDRSQYGWFDSLTDKKWSEEMLKFNEYWWVTLPKTRECDTLIQGIEYLGLPWFFCSTAQTITTVLGKRRWAWDYFPGKEVVFLDDKSLIAGTNTVLIDDYEENIKAFHIAGGRTICFPRPWNFNREYEAVAVVGAINYLQSLKDGAISIFGALSPLPQGV